MRSLITLRLETIQIKLGAVYHSPLKGLKNYLNNRLKQKLKFQLNCPDLGIASIHPTDIVHANEIWIYNTKTRKLIRMPKKKSLISQKIQSETKTVRLNEDFAKILGEFERLLSLRGEFFRARAYKVAKESVMMFTDNISELSQLKGQKGIGVTIYTKLDEYMKTGTIKALEKERANPTIVFSEIFDFFGT